MTAAAARFIAPLTLETISRHKVTVDMFTDADNTRVEHIALARFADLAVIAPATANFIGKLASGIADDMLTTTIMAVRSPVIVCPAMNENMWFNPIVKENVEKLKRHGYRIVGPEYGEMACGGEGWGRLAALSKIVDAVEDAAREADGKGSTPQ
jgi:phosphopantothenoylcysteine decarboxylase/phosphopantothenate--cysteine ligase